MSTRSLRRLYRWPGRQAGSTPLVIAALLVATAIPAAAQSVADPDSGAPSSESMQSYVEEIEGAGRLEMVPVPAGSFVMGSRPSEPGRGEDEGPQRRVTVEPFWIARTEVPWELYRVFMLGLDLDDAATPGEGAIGVDAITRPTPPYVPMDFGMGVEGYPAIGMTQFAARQFTRWLSAATGRFYRLPSEAEWEYACRAGSETAWSFGDDVADLDEHAWYADNAPDGYRPIGSRAPNRWGLHDLHGNVAEWTLDQYVAPYPELSEDESGNPVVWPTTVDPRVVRGGSWRDPPEALRCAARRASHAGWQRRDPQFPKSIWYLTDAPFVGLRVVRPLREPTEEERRRAWEPDVDSVRRILDRQHP